MLNRTGEKHENKEEGKTQQETASSKNHKVTLKLRITPAQRTTTLELSVAYTTGGLKHFTVDTLLPGSRCNS